jgi:glutamyl-tRNA synthetase
MLSLSTLLSFSELVCAATMPAETVRTRFAPSPTGYLHIGGVRTALFNWLFSRQHGGQFLLRVDDTDQQRNVEAALAPILHGFRWLGLDWDEGPQVGGPYGPYFQSHRGELYQAAVEQLLTSGAAYRDFAKPEELQAEREAAEKAGRPFIYSRTWAATTQAEASRFEAEGRQSVVRLKMPREGELVLNDLIRGEVRFAWASEQDHVIQRTDGSCLYHLASVVDDEAMRITHVIRAEEHLPNTPRQVFIAQSLGYDLPAYAHLPYVAEPGSKTKLSKRKLDKYLKNRDFAALMELGHSIARRAGFETTADTFNPVIVDFYERIGFLADALLNYLLLLGWSFDAEREEFSREEMIKHFSLERVNKAPASFDPQKLLSFQDRAMQRLPLKQKVKKCLPFLQAAGLVSEPPPCDTGPYLSQVLTAAGDRVKVAGDILDYAEFFLPDDAMPYDWAALEKRLVKATAAKELLAEYVTELTSVEPFKAAALEAHLKAFVERKGVKLGDLVHAIRVSITGKAIGFGLFDALSILGREHSMQRIKRALALAQNKTAPT